MTDGPPSTVNRRQHRLPRQARLSLAPPESLLPAEDDDNLTQEEWAILYPPSSPRSLAAALNGLHPYNNGSADDDTSDEAKTQFATPESSLPRPRRYLRTLGVSKQRQLSTDKSNKGLEKGEIVEQPSRRPRARLQSRSESKVLGEKSQFPLTAVVTAAVERNKVHDAQSAISHFERREWSPCRRLCLDVLMADPSEAIAARTHMMLGALQPEYHSIDLRMFHLKQSLKKWKKVISRNGISRYPIEQALRELVEVQRHLNSLQAEIEALDSGSESGELS